MRWPCGRWPSALALFRPFFAVLGGVGHESQGERGATARSLFWQKRKITSPPTLQSHPPACYDDEKTPTVSLAISAGYQCGAVIAVSLIMRVLLADRTLLSSNSDKNNDYQAVFFPFSSFYTGRKNGAEVFVPVCRPILQSPPIPI